MWRFVTLLLLPFLLIDVIIAADPCPCYSPRNPENSTINGATDNRVLYNPQYTNNTACAADCTYNVQNTNQLGISVMMAYCTTFSTGTFITLSDGCSTWNVTSCEPGKVYLNGTCSTNLVINLIETSPNIYYLQVGEGPISITTTTVKPTTTRPWTGSYPDPTGTRMDIAIGVDFYATDNNFYPTLVNFLNGTFSQFDFGTDPATLYNRLSWFLINPGSGGISDPQWSIDSIATLIKKMDVTPIWTIGGPSNYSAIITKFIEQGFNNDTTNSRSARPNTQKILLLFTSSDATPNDVPGLTNLPTELKRHDVHTIIVNMAGKPLPILEMLIPITTGSNIVQEYNYTLGQDLETNVKNFINFLNDGKGLCGLRNYDPIPTPPSGTVGFKIPESDSTTDRVQPQLYCNNMDYQYFYNFTATASGSVLITFPIFDLAIHDNLYVYNGNLEVASFTGQLYNPSLCIDYLDNAAISIGFKFKSGNGLVYSGVQVNVTTTAAPCNNPTFQPGK